MSELKLRAMAKINLGLDVTGVREDGYHEVKMIMQSIYLYDRIFLKIPRNRRSRSQRICLIFRRMKIILPIRRRNF